MPLSKLKTLNIFFCENVSTSINTPTKDYNLIFYALHVDFYIDLKKSSCNS